MKFRTTVILLAVFAALLTFVLIFEKKGKEKENALEEKWLALNSEDVEKITFKKEAETLTFKKDEKGDWRIIEPMSIRADKYEVNRLVEDFSNLRIERVVEPEGADPARYQIPQKEVALWIKGTDQPMRILIGMENPLDNTFFAQKEGDPRIVLIPSSLKSTFEKNLFGFRQKDIFKFETQEVKTIQLRAKEIQWEAQKKEDEWFFEKPLPALARSSQMESLLDTLSNLKAKEFISEEKTAEDTKTYGLENPEYQVTLLMPLTNTEVTFLLHKDTEKTYVTTSLSSQIVVPESDVLSQLEKTADAFREKKVAVFNSWQAGRLWLKNGRLDLTAIKGENDQWRFNTAPKDAVDGSKVETFIRKMENLEAVEFIDPPKGLAEYGLDKPQAEVKIWSRDIGEKEKGKIIHILIGKEDTEKKQVVVKNSRFTYLFRVDSVFLEDFPKDLKDWKAAESTEKKS
ncbi:MAG: DUF4340 domain-containing protein [Candidatus Aminicenantales bacterium]